jgi:hypothetical protein
MSGPGEAAGSSDLNQSSSIRSDELKTQLQSIYSTLPNTDFKQLLMLQITSPELTGADLVNALKEEFPSQHALFADHACTRTTLRILRDLSKCRGLNVDCRQGIKVSHGITKALFGEQASVSTNDAVIRSHTEPS